MVYSLGSVFVPNQFFAAVMQKTLTPSLPTLSVVIPCYNEELFLADCLESLRHQDFQGGFEIIVVDNNSTDGTAALARKFGAVVIFESKRGTCAARQAGTKAARGSIVISTDADTAFATDWLSRVWKSMSADSGIAAVTGPCRYIEAPWWGSFYAQALFSSVNIISRMTGTVWYASACNLAFRKSAWTGYNTKLTQGGDEFDILSKLKKQGKVQFLPDNPVFTSSRRMDKGLIYNVVVTIFWLYLVNYAVSSIVGRSVLGSYPAIRIKTIKIRPRWAVVGSVLAVIAIVSIFLSVAQPTFADSMVHRLGQHISSISHAVVWRR